MTRRLDVLHLITDLDVGGAETMLRNVVTRMNRERFRLRVVSMTTLGVIGEELLAAGIEVDALNMRRGTTDPRRFARPR